MATRVFTVGHGRRPLEELVRLLAEHAITQLVDVRHYPRSRRNPQFNREALEGELPGRGIHYVWMGDDLGGFRPGGYQAWMETEDFRRGLARLEALAARQTSAIMCAETVWFRCHRRFIARELVARGYRVTHIVRVGKQAYEEPLSAETTAHTLAAGQGRNHGRHGQIDRGLGPHPGGG